MQITAAHMPRPLFFITTSFVNGLLLTLLASGQMELPFAQMIIQLLLRVLTLEVVFLLELPYEFSRVPCKASNSSSVNCPMFLYLVVELFPVAFDLIPSSWTLLVAVRR